MKQFRITIPTYIVMTLISVMITLLVSFAVNAQAAEKKLTTQQDKSKLTPKPSKSNLSAPKIELPIVKLSGPNWPPYFFTSPENDLPGLAHEVLQICIKKSGFMPSFETLPIKRIFQSLEEGTMDINVMSRRKDREKMVLYSNEALFHSKYKPFVVKGSDIKIKSIKDFNPLRVGHFNGLKYSPKFFKYIKKRIGKGTVEVVDRQVLNIKKLAINRIDVFVGTSDNVNWLAEKIGKRNLIQEVDFTLKSASYYLTVSYNSKNIMNKKEFIKKFDSCVRNLKQKGIYNAIRKKYLGGSSTAFR